MNFDTSFERLIGHEGGYVNNPNDPGGETKFGISKRAFPNEDIKNMTLERAKEIYWGKYWLPLRTDQLPESVRFDIFDTAVNSGNHKAIELLQKACGAEADGVLGPQTIDKANNIDPERLAARFNGWRLDYLNDLPTWTTFGRGWAQRIAINLINA